MEAEHPLFMTSCPHDSDFTTNCVLGALVSLIDETYGDTGNTATSNIADNANQLDHSPSSSSAVAAAAAAEQNQKHIITDRATFLGLKKVEKYGRVGSRSYRRSTPYIHMDLDEFPRPQAHRRSSLGQVQVCLALTGI
jgi:hypothetical protein